ncbi:phosphate permease [Pseudoxanthomonas kalamensis DSM 18571]|uniref:inorganic phosphate transporter n=1 Tax=Pseudoxanthomonas kalamensis TaxID=289483 RepID=UPI001391A8BA|nr:inorganic phosphate transporter [Pseudoxanthomonas kalamensis]KAF1712030.1 phosphate permease [Pseudoxanthomonas kalamensis DSM 18571]
MSSTAPTSDPAQAANGGISKLSVFFAALLVVVGAYFLYWANIYTNSNNLILLVLASLFGIFMAFNIGGNDVANSFGTSVGAGTLTIKQALVIAAVFEVSGAVIAGGEVTGTIRGGIVDLGGIEVHPMDFIHIMMSALVAAALWLLFATKKGYPVSTTHSIVGAIVGSSITLGFLMNGADTALSLVQWGEIGKIAMSWVVSPLLGGVVAYILFSQIKKHILDYNDQAESQLTAIREEKHTYARDYKDAFDRLSDVQKIAYTHALARDMTMMTDNDFRPDEIESDYYRGLHAIDRKRDEIQAHRALENWVPLVAAIGSMIIGAMLLFKGLKHIDLGLTTLHNYLIMGMTGAAVWMATFIFAKTLKSASLGRATFLMFSWMQVFTAAGFAFSHGSNDIANAIGPFAAILDVLRTGQIDAKVPVPTLTMVTFGVALIVGLWFIGKEVIRTVGTNLTEMHPASGFSAELAAASVVMLASTFGLPVSSTHILIGAVLGIGVVNRQNNWDLMKPIGLAWVITLPAAAILSSIAFLILRWAF